MRHANYPSLRRAGDWEPDKYAVFLSWVERAGERKAQGWLEPRLAQSEKSIPTGGTPSNRTNLFFPKCRGGYGRATRALPWYGPASARLTGARLSEIFPGRMSVRQKLSEISESRVATYLPPIGVVR